MISYACMGKLPKAFPERLLPRIARECSRLCGKRASGKAVVGLRFTSEAKIADLNRAYRGKKTSTDVLSFSATEQGEDPFPEPIQKGGERDLGDVVICPAVAAREARRRSIDLTEELVRLVVHGTMHLCGFDHADQKGEERMFGLQEAAVEKVLG